MLLNDGKQTSTIWVVRKARPTQWSVSWALLQAHIVNEARRLAYLLQWAVGPVETLCILGGKVNQFLCSYKRTGTLQTAPTVLIQSATPFHSKWWNIIWPLSTIHFTQEVHKVYTMLHTQEVHIVLSLTSASWWVYPYLEVRADRVEICLWSSPLYNSCRAGYQSSTLSQALWSPHTRPAPGKQKQ